MNESTDTRQRSPNYPAYDLATSVADVATLYQKNGRYRIGLEPLAKALGYKSLSGPARSRIAAMRHFGLLDSSGGLVSPSDRGLTLALRSSESPEYREALREAALEPEIFRELAQTHMDASEDALHHYLVVIKKFSPDGARKLAETFRDTMRLVSLSDGSYDEAMTTEAPRDFRTLESTSAIPEPRTRGSHITFDSTYTWPLSSSRSVHVGFEGGFEGEEDLDTLIDYLEVVRRTLKRAQQRQERESEEDADTGGDSSSRVGYTAY